MTIILHPNGKRGRPQTILNHCEQTTIYINRQDLDLARLGGLKNLSEFVRLAIVPYVESGRLMKARQEEMHQKFSLDDEPDEGGE
jgi:hypothetical protein